MIVPGSASPLLTTTEGGGYTIDKSLRLRRSASANLSRTPASAGNRKTWTASFWMKRGEIVNNYSVFTAYINTDNSVGIFLSETIEISFYETTRIGWVISNAVFRDPSAWYHVVVAVDTTQATASNRIKLYVNGSQITSLGTATYPNQNTDLLINSANAHRIGMQLYPGYPHYFDGYLSDFYFIDGQGLTPSSFGETDATTSVWKPKAYSGTYGTNGFYLKFNDVATTSGSNSGLGKDFSGNGNYWNTNNISVTSGSTYDSMKDVPTLTDTDTANYAVMNPLIKSSLTEHSEANLKLKRITSDADTASVSTIAMTSGKWYWEIKLDVLNTTGNTVVGVAKSNLQTSSTFASANIASFGHASTNQAYRYGTLLGNLSSNMAQGDIVALALDMDAGTLAYYKNNTLIYTTTGLDTTVPHYAYWDSYSVNETSTFNFGQRPFTYTPPTGYKALNTYNLSDSTIKAGNKYMDATTYTGNGSTATITNAGSFKPDLIWIKARNQAYDNVLEDSVRGVTKSLPSNGSSAEGTFATSVTAINSNGFTLGSATAWNENTTTYVGWQWQAGQGSSSSNTSGNVTSTVSVNASVGFSIVTYTVTSTASMTIGHGLGVAPKFIMEKRRDGIANWDLYHASLGNTGRMQINSTAGFDVQAGVWNNTSPTSTVFSQQGNGGWHSVGSTCVAYCWAEIAGFSKFGSYTGNGSTDGAFIYLGFRPKFIMVKRTDTNTNWWIMDTSRNPNNVMGQEIYPNLSSAEAQWTGSDYLSNGIKFRTTDIAYNANGGNYIYAAFAENPFKNSLAR